MDKSSIVSSFQFINFKIDRINFETKQNTSTLHQRGIIDSNLLDLEIALRSPHRIKKDNAFISGFDIRFVLNQDENKEPDQFIFKGNMGISGLFKSSNELSDEVAIDLATIHGPAILLPYLRSAFTSLISSAGFSSVILPLINMHNLAKGVKDTLSVIDL